MKKLIVLVCACPILRSFCVKPHEIAAEKHRCSSALFYALWLLILWGVHGVSSAQSDFTVTSVNDWGSGFKAVIKYVVKPEEAGRSVPWKLKIANSGGATLTKGLVRQNKRKIDFYEESANLYIISNESVKNKHNLRAGKELKFVLHGEGGGFSASDYTFEFITDNDGIGNNTDNFTTSFVSVKDRRRGAPERGFRATYKCEAIERTNAGIFVEFNYSGTGTPTNSWTRSYSGRIKRGFIGEAGGYALKSVSSGYVPVIKAGKSFQVVIVVENATFNASDFAVSCNGEAIIPNTLPLANAGQDQSVLVGAQVTLDGGQSTDADGDLLSFDWHLIEAPPGSLANLDNPEGLTTTFEVDKFGDYRIQLIVDDGRDASLPDEAIVSTYNSAPAADAGPDQQAFVSDLVVLNGGGSTDFDGDTLAYFWSIVSTPEGSVAVLSDPSGVLPDFSPDLPGEYIFELVVSDGIDNSDPDTASVNVEIVNTKPVANAGEDQSAVVGTTVVLDGAASLDADGDALYYEWSVLSQPDLSDSVADPTDGLTSTLLIDHAGDYLVQLIVDDGEDSSDPDTVSISTINSKPIANISPIEAGTAFTARSVILNGSGSEDPDGDDLQYHWSVIAQPEGSVVTIDQSGNALASLVPDIAGDYIIQLIVNDGTSPSEPVTESISVESVESLAVEYSEPVSSEVFSDNAEFTLIIQLNQPVTARTGDTIVVSDADDRIALPVSLVEGENALTVEFENEFQEQISQTFTFYLDTIAPPSPDSSAIAVYVVGSELTVTGAAGSVEPGSVVTLTNLTTESSVTAIAESDGSFTAVLEGTAQDNIGIISSDAVLNASDTLIISGSNVDPNLSSSLSGRIISITEDVIAGAVISALNLSTNQVDVQTVSQTDGTYQLALNANTNYLMQVAAPQYTDQFKAIASLPLGEALVFDISLISRVQAFGFIEDIGGEIPGFAGSSVTVQGNSFEQAPGTRLMQLAITPLDLTQTAVVNALPGELTGTTDLGEEFDIAFYGAVEIEVTDDAGNELNLLEGIDAVIAIPLFINDTGSASGVLVEGDVVPVWTINEATGTWNQEGVGTVVVDELSPTGLAVVAEVSYFSTHAMGNRVSQNTKPVAVISGELTATVGDEITLDATASSDVEEDTLTFQWSLISQPEGSNVQLAEATTESLSFVASIDGLYTVQLIVNDGIADSDPVTETITVSESVLPLIIESLEPADGTFVTQENVEIEVQLNQPAITYVGDAPIVSDELNRIVLSVPLVEGPNMITLLFESISGETVEQTFTYFLDTIAPPIPDSSAISVSVADAEMTVTGVAGSVEPGSVVTLINLNTEVVVSVIADVDGAFTAIVAGTAQDNIGITTSDAALNISDSLTISGSTVDPELSSALTGLVSNALEQPVAGAAIKALNPETNQVDVQTVSQADGTYQLELNADTEYVLQVISTEYVDQIKPLSSAPAGESQVFNVALINRAEPDTFAEDIGGDITGESGSSVSVQGNSFEESLGTGPIEVTITPLDTTNPAVVEAFPGDSTTTSDQGDALAFFGAVEIEFTDANGNELDLVPGVSAQISIPVYENETGSGVLAEGDSVPVWVLDEQTGKWIEDSVGTVVVNAQSPTGLALQAEVSHFSNYAGGTVVEASTASIDQHQLNNLILIAATLDSDDDGAPDIFDEFPFDPTEIFDTDGDGVGDFSDAFPFDETETLDSDLDGVGDTADAFPFDSSETVDSDGDGVGDIGDKFPLDSTEWADSDGDGIGDNADTDEVARASIDDQMLLQLILIASAMPSDVLLDSDGDGAPDSVDAFPFDSAETTDSDADGIGDNNDNCPLLENTGQANQDADASGDDCDTDDDNDGFADVEDDFPFDSTRSVNCAAGSYGAFDCTDTVPGQYVPEVGATQPLTCSVGSYSSVSGSTECTLASAGTYVSVVGATQTQQCELGTYSSVLGSVECLAAEIGYFVDTTGSSIQFSCPAGFITESTRSASVTDCSVQLDSGSLVSDGEPPIGAASAQNDTGIAKKAFGMVAHNFNVDRVGDFNLDIPVNLPDAPGGITPQLALGYNSGSRGGLLGVGFNLHGVSSVSRCGLNYATNGVHRAIKFDYTDNYCLDGMRLIATTAGGEFRTENNNFKKIVATTIPTESSRRSPEAWIVTDKRGYKYRYGVVLGDQSAQDDGKLKLVSSDGVASSEPALWSLSSVEDPLGNNYRIFYYQDEDKSHQVITKIKYGTVEGTKVEVSFQYFDRNDPQDFSNSGDGIRKLETFSKGYRFSNHRYLKKLSVKRDGKIFQEYTFKYNVQRDFARWMLEELSVCSAESCLPSKKFTWNDRPVNSTGPGDRTSHGQAYDRNITGDFDGDGRTDIAARVTGGWRICLSRINRTSCHQVSTSSNIGVTSEDVEVADFNGDGMSDILMRVDRISSTASYRWRVCFSDYDTEDQKPVLNCVDRLELGSSLFGSDDRDLFWPRVGDFNADGRADIFGRNGSNGIRGEICFSTGEEFECIDLSLKKADDFSSLNSLIPSASHFLDYNGDGATDLLVKSTDDSTPWYLCSKASGQFSAGSNNATFNCNADNLLPKGYDGRIWAGDFNGDGNVDLTLGLPNQLGKWRVFLSDGEKYLHGGDWDGPKAVDDNVVIADYNGDGRSDVAARMLGDNIGKWHVSYAGASGFVSRANSDFIDDLGAQSSDTKKAIVGDFDGDGRSEIAGIRTDKTKIYIPAAFGYSAPVLIGVYDDYPGNSETLKLQKESINVAYSYTGTSASSSSGYPTREIRGNVLVARTVTVPNANLTSQSPLYDKYLYDYSGMKVNRRGLGMLGFERRAVTKSVCGGNRVSCETSSNSLDTRVGKTTYIYRQDFPFIGMLSKVITGKPTPLQSLDIPISIIENEYAVDNSNNPSSNLLVEPYHQGVQRPYFTYLANSTSFEYDVEKDTSVLLKTTVSELVPNQSGELHDEYGNSLKSRQKITDNINGYSWTVETDNSYHPPNDHNQVSLLDRVEKTSKATTPGSSDIKNVEQYKYHDYGLIMEKIIEPDASDSQYLKTTYDYDDLGELSLIVTQGRDSNGASLPARTSTITTTYTNASQCGTGSFSDVVKRVESKTDAGKLDGLTISSGVTHTAVSEISLNYGRPHMTSDINGHSTCFEYDTWGRLATEYLPDRSQRLYSEITWAGGSGTDTAFSIQTVQYIGENGTKGAADQTVYTDYSNQTVLTSSTGFSGETLYEERVYDTLGRLDRVSLPYESGSTPEWARSEYSTIYTERLGTFTSAENVVTRYSYNGYDMKSVTGERMHWERVYANGLTHEVIEGDNVPDEVSAAQLAELEAGLDISRIEYQFDGAGRLVKTIDSANNEIVIGRNSLGRKISQDDPDTGKWHYRYNSYGELEWQEDAKGQGSTTVHDFLGRVVLQDNASGVEETVWDTADRGIGMVKLTQYTPAGHTSPTYRQINSYDELSRLQVGSECIAKSGETLNADCQSDSLHMTRHFYDSVSRIRKVILPGGKSVTRKYASNGWLENLKKGDGGPVFWEALEYDARGRLVKEKQQNKVETTYRYEGPSVRPTRIESFNESGAKIVEQDYGYHQGTGQLDSRTDHIFDMVESYRYDGLARLKEAQLTYQGLPTQTYAYKYDRLGNIVLKEDAFGSEAIKYGASTRSGRPLAHAVSNVGSTNYLYDDNGNIEQKGNVSIQWNAFNKPVSIQKAGDDDASVLFQYKTNRMRVRKTEGDKDTTYVMGGGVASIEIDRNSTGVFETRYHYVLNGRVVSIDTVYPDNSTDERHMHHDVMGSVVAITDDDGLLHESYSYDVWGKRRAVESADDNDYPSSVVRSVIHNRGYTGHEVLASVGLVHMNGRIYDQEIGRFLSPDPFIQDIKNTQNFNRYSYVLNDPMNYTDPSGYIIKGLKSAINGALGAVGDVIIGFGNLAAGIVNTAADGIERGMKKLGEIIEEHCESCYIGVGGTVDTEGNYQVSGRTQNTETGQSYTFFTHEWENNRDPGFGTPETPLPVGAEEIPAIYSYANGRQPLGFEEHMQNMLANGYAGDGHHLTIEEAYWWWKHAAGTTLIVDGSVLTSDGWLNRIFGWDMVGPSWSDTSVHGSEETDTDGRLTTAVFDWDHKPFFESLWPQDVLKRSARNYLNWNGRQEFGPGTPFIIRFRYDEFISPLP